MNPGLMDPSKAKGIIFDFNGVIIDDYLLQKQAWSHISEALRGRPVTDEEMRRKIRGVPTKDIIVWMSGNELSKEQINDFAQQKTATTRLLFDTSPSLRPAHGLVEFLDELAERKIPRTIATSQAADAFNYLFNKLGLEKWFNASQAVCYDGTYPGKPAPDAYVIAARKIGIQPSQCIVVEDAQSGVRSAYDAGVRNIIVIGQDEQLKELSTLPGVIKAIHDFSEIHNSDLFRNAS